jgi:type VII secretion protein EccB
VWTQRDQIQAYQFLRRRLVSALVTADANHPTSPSRRLVLGTVLGVAGAVLIAAAFGVIGLLDQSGSADWRQGGQVIVEKETGARYVLGQDRLLHPVLNYASARLLAGGDGTATVTVPSDTLRSASRGAMLGIPGAPDSLPGKLTDTMFTSCSRVPPDLPAATAPISTMVVGSAAPTGPVLAPDQAVLVAPPSGDEFLVTGGQRHRLPGRAEVAALGYEDVPAVPVSPAWLDTVPAGRDLAMVTVPDAGAPGPTIAGTPTRIGQVLGDGALYLVRGDGVVPIGETEARLVLGGPSADAAYADGRPSVARLSPSALDGAPRSSDRALDYPAVLPKPVAVTRNVVLCAAGDGTDAARISTSDRLPVPAGATAARVATRTDARVADEVYVPPGSGALVGESVGGVPGTGATYLVTDTGMKNPVAGPAVAALGYGGVAPRQVAGTLLALLPTGPSLDPVAARQVVVSGGGAR